MKNENIDMSQVYNKILVNNPYNYQVNATDINTFEILSDRNISVLGNTTFFRR